MDYFPPHKKLLLSLYETKKSFDLIIPFHGLQRELLQELRLKSVKTLLITERSIIIESHKDKLIWAQDWWPNCQILPDAKESFSTLKNLPHLGIYHQTEVHTLADRTKKKIRSLPLKRIHYQPNHPFDFKFFAWTVISGWIIYCTHPFQRFPLGWHEFVEEKSTPPNRAYLKLWEILGVYNIVPEANSNVIEIGASPGGWSWVLSQNANHIYTFDRAPLAPQIAKIQNIYHTEGDAFKISPDDYKDCTWFFSDIICTPEKLYEILQPWIKAGHIKNFVCTIKFKGDCDFDILKKFTDIGSSKLIHLYQNKNEITWICQQKG